MQGFRLLCRCRRADPQGSDMQSDTPVTPLLGKDVQPHLPPVPAKVLGYRYPETQSSGSSEVTLRKNLGPEPQPAAMRTNTESSQLSQASSGGSRFPHSLTMISDRLEQLFSITEDEAKKQTQHPNEDHGRHLRIIDGTLTDIEEVLMQTPDIDMHYHNEHVLRQTLRRLWLSQLFFRSAWQGFIRWNRCQNWCKLPLTQRLRSCIYRKQTSKRQPEPLQAVYFRVVPPSSATSSDNRPFPHQMPPLNLERLEMEHVKACELKAVSADRRGWKKYKIKNHLLTRGAKVHLSPEFFLTLPRAAREDAGIPLDATHFSFSYPVEKRYLKKGETPEDTPIDDLLLNGGFLYFQQLDRTTERALRSWFWPFDISWRFQVVGVLCVCSGATPTRAGDVKELYFGAPLWLEPHEVTGQWFAKQDITLDFLYNMGARHFCWIAPQENLANEDSPIGFPDGGFLYWGNWTNLPGKDQLKGLVARKETREKWWHDHLEALTSALNIKRQVEHQQHGMLLNELDVAFRTGLEASLPAEADEMKRRMKRAERKLQAIQQARFGLHLEVSKSRFLTAYFTFFSFRVPFSMLISLLVWMSFVAGMQMELFFTVLGAIYDEDYELPNSSVVFFILLPHLMVFAAVTVDRLWWLILDALAPPYMMKFRAKVLVVYHHTFGQPKPGEVDTGKPSERSCFILDIFMFIVLEFLPWGGLLYNAIGFTCFDMKKIPHLFFVGHEGLNQAVSGGFMTGTLEMCIILTLFICAVEIKYSFLEWHCNAGMSFQPEVSKVEEIQSQAKVFPYFIHSNYLAFKSSYHVAEQQADDNIIIGDYHRRKEKQDEDLTPGRTLLCVSFGMWVVVSLIFAKCAQENSVKNSPWKITVDAGHGRDIGSWLFMTGAFCLAFAIVGISFKLRQDLPTLTSASYWVFLIILMVMNSSMLIGATMMGPQGGSSSGEIKPLDPIMRVLRSGEAPFTDELPLSWKDKGQAQKYPLCRMSWGSDDAPLSAIDLGALAWISYEPSGDPRHQINELLQESFRDRNPELLNYTDYNDIPRWISVRFKAKSEGKKDTIAFAIKGTSTLKDGYLDTDLFTFIKALQFSSYVVPVLNWMPKDLVQWGTYMIKMRFGFGGTNEAQIWKDIKTEINKLQEKYGDTADFVITGHSLGGALAEVAAGQTSLPAVQWSGPGTHFTERFFDVSEAEMQRDVVSVVPDLDVVPRVDEHDSVVARIQCLKKYGELASPLDCHSLLKSVCEVWRVCGDKEKRDFGQSCSQFIAKEELGILYQESYTER